MSGPATVAVVDNHEAVQRGIAAVVEELPAEFSLVGCYPDPEPLIVGAIAVPDIVILDLWLGRDDVHSLGAIEPLREAGTRVLLHTSEERPARLRAAVQAGVLGLALKSDGTDDFLATLRGVAAGEFACSSELAAALLEDGRQTPSLARREIDVLESLADGLTRDQVALRLGISGATVKTYLTRIREKYLALGRDVTNATSLILEARRDGYSSPPKS